MHSSRCKEFDEIQKIPKAAGDFAINNANTIKKQNMIVIVIL